MTDLPEGGPTEAAATDPATDPAEVGDVTALADDVARDNEQVRDGLAAVRDGLEQLRSQIQDANGLTLTSADLLSEFKQTADALNAERQQLEREKAALVSRASSVMRAEQERDQGYADLRAALDRELAERRAEVLAALEAELAGLRSTRLREVAQVETAERERVRAEIDRERSEWDETRARQQQNLKQQQVELERQKGAVSALQSELEGRRVELDENDLDLERRKARNLSQAQRRSDNHDEEVAERIAEERKSFQGLLQVATEETERLRGTIQSQTALLGAFEHLQQQLGGRDPGAVILELSTLRDEIKRQAEDLASRPTEEVRTRFNALTADNQGLQNRIEELERQVQNSETLASQSSNLKRTNIELEQKNASLDRLAKNYEAEANKLQAELDRLRAAYERPAETEARYKEIELPRIEVSDITPTTLGEIAESEWLEGVGADCDAYGLHFSLRILKAFHTALKTAEWSPITVLAGVSGTGKSELPRLYSHFGGLYFEPLSVQPNWDSQESMLGFFNSIDNRFDAQPVLRFLGQSQKRWIPATEEQDGYPGLADAMCLVLLDEMNLAHPELYFAEFLSKLELRRGKKGSDVPTLPIKVGAGMKPYELPLGRNVLWAGTMNQDETTKSLSDKVLDRSIIIHFPRPTDLKRRQKLAPLDAKNRGDNLPAKTWQSWIARESTFTEEEVKPYKSFIEEMNDSLAVAGRAIGHRVWQSVEYYMANYPDVRAADGDSAKKARAMHVAFEDQLVQKVMPKLRGIDTRGKSKDECLDKIRVQLLNGIGGNGFNLAEDFDLATELGYGQFIWQSANYLKVDDSDEPS
jgi:predicted  nucleic acid-binding Zn-ribbon protein